MRAHVRFVGLLMVVVLLAAIVAAAGPVAYIVTLDDYGNSYYLNSTGDGTLEPQTLMGTLPITGTYGVGIGDFTSDEYYDFIVGTSIGDPLLKEIYLYEMKMPIENMPIEFKKVDNPIGFWSSGDYPADMPVANFDGKVYDPLALDDFVMVRAGNPDVGLYINKGGGVYENRELTGAAPSYSFGADVADINHDGLADFVVASANEGLIYVTMANADGTFTTNQIPTPTLYGTPLWGITAADFDGDLNVDLIATSIDSSNGFEFYKGDGTGRFTPTASETGRFGIGQISASSPVDNYDLNGDGDQDIVASNIPGYPNGVIVGLNLGTLDNNGVPQFTFTGPYLGDATGYLYTIAAPPVFQNEAPVAVVSFSAVSPGVLYDGNVIIAGTTIKFSSYDSTDVSYDPEGKELEYSWSFGDGSPLETGVDVTHLFNTPGSYGVTLTLTDNYGATMEKTVTIKVNYPPVAIDDDMYSTNMNNPLAVVTAEGVLVNDKDEDGDPLTAILVSKPTSGMVDELKADGSFTYTPSEDFTGMDSFTYKVNDGLEDSANTATVTIAVNSPAFQTWDVNIVPGMINLKSRGVFIAFITLPKPYSAADVQQTSVFCEGAYATRLIRHAKFPQVFGAIFRTADLKDLKVGNQKLTVTGTVMYEGLPYAFSGDDTVRVFTLKTKVRDESEGWEQHGEKKLFDEHFKGNNNNKDNQDKKDNR